MGYEMLLNRVTSLCARSSGLGIGSHIYALSPVELEGLDAFLKRVSGAV